MRWSIVALIMLGVIAAASASLLTASLQSRPLQATVAPAQAAVLVAARPLAPLAVLTAADLSSHTLAVEHLPADALAEPVQAIGKVLVVPLQEGQVITSGAFAPTGPGSEMVTTLRPGMRAVALSLALDSSLHGLLYPGCIVDVLVAFRLGGQSGGEALSTNLLEGIQVLAIDDQVIGAAAPSSGESPAAAGGAGRRNNVLVTLMVDSHQAKALQLASEYGAVTLALRNPTDPSQADANATLLSGGRMAQLASMLESQVAAASQAEEGVPQQFLAVPEPTPTPEPVATPTPTPEPTPRPAPRPTPSWQIEILRAGASEIRSFPLDRP